jgi:hypothetical protein
MATKKAPAKKAATAMNELLSTGHRFTVPGLGEITVMTTGHGFSVKFPDAAHMVSLKQGANGVWTARFEDK